MSSVLYIAFAVLVAVLGLAFHVRNDQVVVLDYYAGALRIELSLILVATLVIGVLLGVAAMSASLLRLRRELRRLQRQHSAAGRELASLRALGLDDAR